MNHLQITPTYLDIIADEIRLLDTQNLSNDFELVATSVTIEEQKTYFWIRVFLNEEDPNLIPGDEISIEWTPTQERLDTKFIAWAKSGLERDHQGVTNYNPEDDKRILCLMIEDRAVNQNPHIPFLRTLFKAGHFFEYQLMKREELLFINKRNGHILDYFDCSF